MNYFEIAKTVSDIIVNIFLVLMAYKVVMTVIGLFKTKVFGPAKQNHKYAIVIAARNEEAVIGNLLESIKNQDYDMSLVDVFVVADNCTDKTAKVAREMGAVCYERFDKSRCTKGYALQFLFEQIERDYKTDSYEGFFVFDADNLLSKDYITRMNEAFDAGEKIIVSYRNSKNFDENWVASTYAIHWLRSVRVNHRARSFFGLATNIQGTGFLFTNEIVKNGWKYVSLTEDRALTADAVVAGYRITYCDAAVFYDEQPTSVKISVRQRVRWAKGHIQAFAESGPGLFKNIFCAKGFRAKFMSYDILMQVIPQPIFDLFRLSALFVVQSVYLLSHNTFSVWSAFLLTFLWGRIYKYIKLYFSDIFLGLYVQIAENRRIQKFSFLKHIQFCFTWPLFDFMTIWAMYIALFKKVEWKPIPHTSKVKIQDIDQKLQQKSTVKK